MLYEPAVPLLGMYLEKTIIQKDTCTPVFTAGLFTGAKILKQSTCPLTEECGKMCGVDIDTQTCMCTMEYYSALKKKEMMPFEAVRLDLEVII